MGLYEPVHQTAWNYKHKEDICSTIEAEVILPNAIVRLIKFHWYEPIDTQLDLEGKAMLDMCLSPRPKARACFEDAQKQSEYHRIGDLFFLPPDIAVRAHGNPGSQRSLQCLISPELCRNIRWDEAVLRKGLDLNQPSFRTSCKRIVAELQAPGFASAALIDALLRTLIIDLVRYFQEFSVVKSITGGLAPWRMKRIEDRVTKNGQIPNVGTLAALCGLSPRQLMRAFRQSQGESIGRYLMRIRIEQAKLRLANGEGIALVAQDLGFANTSSFSTTFRRVTGSSPSHYRAALISDRK